MLDADLTYAVLEIESSRRLFCDKPNDAAQIHYQIIQFRLSIYPCEHCA